MWVWAIPIRKLSVRQIFLKDFLTVVTIVLSNQRAMTGVKLIKPIGSQREIGIWLLQTRLCITHINTATILFKPTRLSLLEDILIVTLVG